MLPPCCPFVLFSQESDICVRCDTDALVGTVASLGALRGTDCRMEILRSVALPSVFQEAMWRVSFCNTATGFLRFAVSLGKVLQLIDSDTDQVKPSYIKL